MEKFKCFAIFQLICFYFVFCECNLEEFYHWKQMSFDGLPLDKDVIPYSNVPMSVSHYKGKLFITVPRRKPGIPSTLNYVPDDLPVGSSPNLRPYPDFKSNELHPELKSDENRIISVYRTRVDECGRLWFVDTGILEQNGTEKIQLPSIWVIDLNTDKVVRRFDIPDTIFEGGNHGGNGMISLKIDTNKDKCDDAYAYIPDYYNNKICVYSLKKNRMWTFSHPYLNYDLKLTKYDFDGFKFQWTNGVASITLGRLGSDGYRKAYFHPMASNSEFQVNTKILQNEMLSENLELYLSDFVKIGNRGTQGQSGMHDFDEKTGAIFFSLLTKSAISCWNSNTFFGKSENQAIVAMNDVEMNFPADLRVDSDGTLWALTNSLPRFIYGKLNTDEYNFRVWRGNTKKLIKGTVCEPKKFTHVALVEDSGPR